MAEVNGNGACESAGSVIDHALESVDEREKATRERLRAQYTRDNLVSVNKAGQPEVNQLKKRRKHHFLARCVVGLMALIGLAWAGNGLYWHFFHTGSEAQSDPLVSKSTSMTAKRHHFAVGINPFPSDESTDRQGQYDTAVSTTENNPEETRQGFNKALALVAEHVERHLPLVSPEPMNVPQRITQAKKPRKCSNQ